MPWGPQVRLLEVQATEGQPGELCWLSISSPKSINYKEEEQRWIHQTVPRNINIFFFLAYIISECLFHNTD